VILLLYVNLTGAVLAFVAYQLMKMIFNAGFFYKVCNFQIGLPKFNKYKWGAIHANISFGLSGLFLTSLNIMAMIFISRHIIAELGLQENGLFSVALKVATVYLGAVYANASSYYFPLLAKSNNLQALSADVNRTSRFYFYLLPPLIIIIMTGGELMVGILFSEEFLPAALLLFLLLPGDLFRISAETLGLPLLVKEKFLAYNVLYCWWCCVYVSLAMYMIERHGLLGVAMAYLLSHIINFISVAVVARLVLKIKLSRGFLGSLFLAVTSLAASSALNFVLEDFWLSVLVNAVVVAIWFALSCLQKEFIGYLTPLAKWIRV
jgi:PST family polysaccharide transporter